MTDEQTPAAGSSLLPCPFCGSASVSEDSTECTEAADYIWFKCEGCGVESEGEHGRDAALVQWNRRPHLASPASSSSVVQGDASGVEPSESLHKASARFRKHVVAMSDGKKTIKAGKPAPDPSPIAAMFSDLPAMLREFEAAAFDVEAAFEEYEDRLVAALRPQPSGETREAVRQAIVKAIAFLKRDLDTPRINDTVESLLADLVKADAILRGEA